MSTGGGTDDVEWRTLGDVIISLNTGLNPRQFFRLNTDDAQNYYVTIREIQNGTVVFNDKTDRINDEALKLCNNRSSLEVGDVLFSGTGTIGETAVISEPPINWNIKEGVYTIKPNKELLNSRFLMFLLRTAPIKSAIKKKSAGGTVQSIPMAELKKLRIPVPSLVIQEKIVSVLDNFDAICSDLNIGLPAEIEARQKQYEYYRDALLSFDRSYFVNVERERERERESCAWRSGLIKLWQYVFGIVYIKLSDVAALSRGVRLVKNDLESEGYPVYQNCLAPMGYFARYNRKANNTYIISAGAAGGIGYSYTDFWAADDCVTFECNDMINNRFLYHLLKSKQYYLYSKVRKASIPRLSRESIEKMLIAVPSIDVQEQIVYILDRFDKLCNDLSEGLPAEIEARQKQYEYYRDKLLSFGKL